MNKDWIKCKLEDYINLIDYRGRTPIKTDNGIRLITAKNVKLGYLQQKPEEFIDSNNYEEWMRRGIPNYGDIIFTTEAPLGNVAQINTTEKLAFAQRIIVMQPEIDKINQNFLKYMFLSPNLRKNLFDKATGATVQGIKSSLLKKIEISFPKSIEEQKQIVEILDKAFESIDQAKANIEKNIENTKELFQSRLNNYNFKKEKLVNIVNIKTGKLNSNEAVEDGKYPFFTCSREVYRIDKYSYDCEAILLAGNNAVGDFNVKHYKGKFDAYQRTYIITSKDESKLNYRFLYFQMMGSLADLKKKSVGTGTKFLRLPMIQSFEIYYPDILEQEKYVYEIDSLNEQTKQLEKHYKQKLKNLEELKKSILQKAFTGELLK